MGTPRGPSSREELKIEWDHPVWVDPVQEEGHTASVSMRRALPADEAYAFVAGDDPRPLLVLRECLTCTGTDDALLQRQADNEKTMLLSRWFHCVKLPPDVTDASHPFHTLFEGSDPGHLFVASRDGKMRADLQGDQSRTELWGVMDELLAESYVAYPKQPMKELRKILGKLDNVDLEIGQLETKLDEVVEDEGPSSKKFKKLKKQLTALRAERNELKNDAVRVSKIELKKPEEARES